MIHCVPTRALQISFGGWAFSLINRVYKTEINLVSIAEVHGIGRERFTAHRKLAHRQKGGFKH